MWYLGRGDYAQAPYAQAPYAHAPYAQAPYSMHIPHMHAVCLCGRSQDHVISFLNVFYVYGYIFNMHVCHIRLMCTF